MWRDGCSDFIPGLHLSVFPEPSFFLSKVKRIPAITTAFNLHDGKSVTMLLMSQQTNSQNKQMAMFYQQAGLTLPGGEKRNVVMAAEPFSCLGTPVFMFSFL